MCINWKFLSSFCPFLFHLYPCMVHFSFATYIDSFGMLSNTASIYIYLRILCVHVRVFPHRWRYLICVCTHIFWAKCLPDIKILKDVYAMTITVPLVKDILFVKSAIDDSSILKQYLKSAFMFLTSLHSRWLIREFGWARWTEARAGLNLRWSVKTTELITMVWFVILKQNVTRKKGISGTKAVRHQKV